MDGSSVNYDFVELCRLSYMTAKDVFGVEPVCAPAKTQTKIRKWVHKLYFEDSVFPEESEKYLPKELSDAEYIEFLKTCYDRVRHESETKKQKFDETAAGLPEEVRDVIWRILEHDIMCDKLMQNGEDVLILMDRKAVSTYDRVLILKNASGVPEMRIEGISFLDDGSLTMDGNEYVLTGEAHNYSDELSATFSILFTDARVETEAFRGDFRAGGISDPWINIQLIAAAIMEKYSLSGAVFNESEKAILPLITEICRLFYREVPKEFNNGDFPELRAYAEKYVCDRMIRLIDKLETAYLDEKKRGRASVKLGVELHKLAYEPLWREIYDKIVESQAEYPPRRELFRDPPMPEEIRSEIESLMEFHGYTGKYPDFVRHGEVRGIRLIESDGTTYFVGHEKNAVFHIHCSGDWCNGRHRIIFSCGTAFLRENETATDIFSCMFDAEGRRLFRWIEFGSDSYDYRDEGFPDALERFVRIAVKKAELTRLTKAERREAEMHPYDNDLFLPIFLSVFIVMGGAFAVCMIIGFMLIAVLMAVIFGQAQKIPEMLMTIPWWKFFIGLWAAFGGVMGAIAALAKKKG